MLLLLILLAFAYIQDNFGRKQPVYVWAIEFAISILVLLVTLGDEFVSSTLMALILGIYAWIFFGVLRIFGSHVMVWGAICLVGTLIPMGISLLFLS